MVGLCGTWDVSRFAHDVERRRHSGGFERLVICVVIVPLCRYNPWFDPWNGSGYFYTVCHERRELLDMFFERSISHCFIGSVSFFSVFQIEEKIKNPKEKKDDCDQRRFGKRIFYRLAGDSLCGMFGAGEYYLVRIYIRPDRQSCGIGRQAILLCEKSMTR